MAKIKRPRKWIQSPDARNIPATVLIWMWEKFCALVDFLTLNLMTGKSWVKKDVEAVRSAHRAATPPEYGEERPTLPAPVIEHMSQAEREEGRAQHGKDFEERRYRWAAKMEAEELIREVGGF